MLAYADDIVMVVREEKGMKMIMKALQQFLEKRRN